MNSSNMKKTVAAMVLPVDGSLVESKIGISPTHRPDFFNARPKRL